MSSSYDLEWHAYPGDKAIHNVDLPPNIPGVLIVPKRYLHADVVAPTVVHKVSVLLLAFCNAITYIHHAERSTIPLAETNS